MIPAELKKFVAFGSGIGIEIAGPRGAESLRIAAVRVRPTGARLLGRLTIEDFSHQPAGVWGTEYAAFLRRLDLRYVPATVILPRQDVILRQLTLPGVADRDLASAIGFQMDGLHPYPEDDVISSWARLPGSAAVMVAIVRRAVIDRYSTWFSEAGVKLGGFTCSAASIYSALRLFGARPPAEILASEILDGRLELYGESPAHPLFSASFEADDARAAARACAELRIDPSTEPKPLESLLSAPLSSEGALPYAAALASACPRLSLPMNVLPADRRQTGSRLAWMAPAALALIAILLAGALFALPGYEDHRYARSVAAEIAKITPRANRAAVIEKEIDSARRRTLLLDDFRRRARSDIDVLAEMTRILPPTVWLNTLDIGRTQVLAAGEADQAAPLLKLIDASPLFESSEFAMPPMRIQNGEAFRIRTNREAGR